MLTYRTLFYDTQTGYFETTLKKGKEKVMNKQSNHNDLEHSGETFYPSFLFKEIVTMMLIFILVAVILAVVFPIGLEDPADPTDNLYIPKPEWYYMALYQLLKYFPGKLEVIATAIIPAGGIIALLILPFIDKGTETRPTKRPIAMAIMVFAVVAIVLLTIIGLKT